MATAEKAIPPLYVSCGLNENEKNIFIYIFLFDVKQYHECAWEKLVVTTSNDKVKAWKHKHSKIEENIIVNSRDFFFAKQNRIIIMYSIKVSLSFEDLFTMISFNKQLSRDSRCVYNSRL
jgi:hypothetical protein